MRRAQARYRRHVVGMALAALVLSATACERQAAGTGLVEVASTHGVPAPPPCAPKYGPCPAAY